MAKRTRAELEKRLAEIESEIKVLRQNLKKLESRSRSAVKSGKEARDKKALEALRKQLGLS